MPRLDALDDKCRRPAYDGGMASVVLQHLDKTFPNGVHAVRDLNLEIADGEFIVLVGPSGCGKSTTLRMIAGLEQPSAGEIHIGGRRVKELPPASRDVAMVFQSYALYPHMTVYQNMAFGLKMRGASRSVIDVRVRDAAEILSIGALLERRPRELSGGQRQRVALGRAIVREPKAFLFDEPLSNLDALLRVQMRAEIARLHRRLKSTIIYVTHDQVEAMTLGERIVLMDHGIVQQVDTPTRIYQQPANRFVGSFIGNPAMNFVRGVVASGVFRFEADRNGSVVGGISDADSSAPYSGCSASERPAKTQIAVGNTVPNGPAVLGIRPEDLLTRADGMPLGTVTLDLIEHVGHETIARFSMAGCEHVVRLPADIAVHPGDQLSLFIRPDALHFFAGDDGRRLN